MEPDAPRMSHDDFRQFVQRTLVAQDQRHADHEARMARMDRQYDKLLQVQLDLARSHDEHEGKMDQLRNIQERQTATMEQMRLTLDAIKEILRERRN